MKANEKEETRDQQSIELRAKRWPNLVEEFGHSLPIPKRLEKLLDVEEARAKNRNELREKRYPDLVKKIALDLQIPKSWENLFDVEAVRARYKQACLNGDIH